MKYDRNPRYLHPFIALKLEDILDAIQAKLPEGYTCKMISAQRTPEDQFKLFKKGRAFQNGTWVIVDRSKVVTHKDGFSSLSRHNYLPSTAIDIGIFRNNEYQSKPALYQAVGEAKKLGLDWGGDWTSFRDTPHLEIPKRIFFENDINKDNGYIWQQYLKKAGTYKGVLDGIFGPKSIAALKAATGESTRNMAAWDKLYEGHGVITV
jgi:peptidoglycan L-alanyl-D-glutamate endopeptidase CwlK